MGFWSACRTFGRLHAAKRAFDQEKQNHPLTYLFWETTLACNLACRHCGSRCSPEEARQKDLPGSEVKRVFHEIAEDFDANKITIAVTGGEPLTRKDVFDVMGDAVKLGYFWGMVTNAVLVDEKVVDKMEKAGMGTISVSIDGDAESHAFLRGSVENFDRAMKGLRCLIERAKFLECVQVTSVIHAKNLHLLETLYERFADMGVGEWRVLLADPIGRMLDPENRELILGGDGIARLLDFVAEKRKGGRMPMTFEESGFLGLKYEGAVRGYYFHCPAGINIGGLMHDGKIGACPSIERHMIEGDALTERFSKVWNERFLRYRDREGHRRKGPCLKCKWWNHCEGGSLHLWDWDKNESRLCHYNLMKQAGCL